MKSNFLRWVFILIAFLAMGWYGAKGVKSYFDYRQVSLPILVDIQQLSVQEIGSDSFRISAEVAFFWNGRTIQESIFIPTIYPNRWAAEKKIHSFQTHSNKIYINPSDPEKMLWERKFPLKQVVTSLITVVVFLYFLFLNFFYVKRMDHATGSKKSSH